MVSERDEKRERESDRVECIQNEGPPPPRSVIDTTRPPRGAERGEVPLSNIQ